MACNISRQGQTPYTEQYPLLARVSLHARTYCVSLVLSTLMSSPASISAYYFPKYELCQEETVQSAAKMLYFGTECCGSINYCADIIIRVHIEMFSIYTGKPANLKKIIDLNKEQAGMYFFLSLKLECWTNIPTLQARNYSLLLG